MAQDDNFLSRWSRRKAQVRQGEAPVPQPVPEAQPALQPQPVPQAGSATAPAPAGADGGANGGSVAPQDAPADAQPAQPALTLDDVATLNQDSDFSRFVVPEVSGEVRNAALKKLFSDPHFNVMDGLDIYIDDYNKPDPLPASILRQMNHSAYLGLVEPEPEKAGATPPLSSEPAAEQAPPECASGNEPDAISCADDADADTPLDANPEAGAMKAHDEDPDLRLQSLPEAGPTGVGPGPGEDAEGQR